MATNNYKIIADISEVGDLFRHGDVIIEKVSSIPSKIKKNKGRDAILAYGEATNHCHQILDRERVTKYIVPEDGTIYFEVSQGPPVPLTHEEHDTILFPPGIYKSNIMDEYTEADEAAEYRRVMD